LFSYIILFIVEIARKEDLTGNIIEDIINVFSNIIAITIVAICYRKIIKIQNFKLIRRKMSWKKLAMFITLVFGIQFVWGGISEELEYQLNIVNLSLDTSLLPGIFVDASPIMILDICLIGPIVEEIVYRGYICNGALRYGKRFAMVISALMFALMHGTLSQTPTAFIVGILFAYVNIEYGLVYSILLHILNNTFSMFIPEWIFNILADIGLVLSLIILYKNRGRVYKALFSSNQELTTEKGIYKKAIKNPWMIIFFVWTVLMIIMTTGVCSYYYQGGDFMLE
jgi:hypothetical protein